MAKFDENYFYENTTSEIKDLLTTDEQLLWQGKPKKSAYIISAFLRMLPVALIWLIFDGTFIGIMVGTGAFSSMPVWGIILICVFFIFHLFPVWIWLYNIITANRQHKNLEYAFTNQRIIIKSGVIGIDITNIYYSDIEGINLKVGLTDKMLKVGDIYITSNKSAKVLWDIENPYAMTTKLQKIVSDIKADLQFPNALRPEENSGYNTKYTNNEK